MKFLQKVQFDLVGNTNFLNFDSQVRILLNKADEITAEELMKIQGNLVWNVSPHMSSSLEPPTLYAGSFWSVSSLFKLFLLLICY